MERVEDPAIWLVGVCHKSAPVAVRERLAYEPVARGRLLRAVREAMPHVEALVLSTCDRTEVYLAGPSSLVSPEALVALHDDLWPGSARRYEAMLERARRDDDAISHLLRVACGLESSVVGDHQILGQLRRAVSAASAAGTLGRWLTKASSLALRAGRRAQAAPESKRTRRGIAYTAVDTIVQHCDHSHVARPKVLLLGAGAVGCAVAEELLRRRDAHLHIANRSISRARALADRVGAAAVAWDAWSLHADAHVVVCATAARSPVLRPAQLEGVPSELPRLILDLGLPRNVHPAVSGDGNVLVTLDDLAKAGDGDDVARRVSFVADALASWHDWRATLRVDGVARAAYGDIEDTVAALVASIAIDGADSISIERAIRQQIRRLVDRQVRRLRSVARELERSEPVVSCAAMSGRCVR